MRQQLLGQADGTSAEQRDIEAHSDMQIPLTMDSYA